MSVTELAQVLRDTLYKYFPNKQEVDLKIEDTFLVLRFIGISLAIEKSNPMALEILLNRAISILEKTHTRIKNDVQKSKDAKTEEFRNNCIRQQTNSAMASSVAAKVDFFDQTMRKPEIKPGLNIKRPSVKETNDISELLDILNDDMNSSYKMINHNDISNNININEDKLSNNNVIFNDIKLSDLHLEDKISVDNNSIKTNSDNYKIDIGNIYMKDDISVFNNDISIKINGDNCKVNMSNLHLDNNNISKKTSGDNCKVNMNNLHLDNNNGISINVGDKLDSKKKIIDEKENNTNKIDNIIDEICGSSFNRDTIYNPISTDDFFEIISESLHSSDRIPAISNDSSVMILSSSRPNPFLCNKLKLQHFKETAFNMIFTGLIGIRSVDRIIRKARSRGLFREKGIVFDDLEVIGSLESEKVGFDICSSSIFSQSQINSSNNDLISNSFDSISTVPPKKTPFDSISAVPPKKIPFESTSAVPPKIVEPMKKIFSETAAQNPTSKTFSETTAQNSISKTFSETAAQNPISKTFTGTAAQNPISKTFSETAVQPSKILKKNDSHSSKSIEEILEGHKYENIGFSRLFSDKNPTKKKNLTESDDVNPLQGMLKDLKYQVKKIPERIVEYNASLDTSLVLDENNVRTQNPPSGVKEAIETKLPDSGMFKKIIMECKDVQYKFMEIIRRSCQHYGLYFPEFEIVRENDVFRCTASFLDINFVSSYEYDKMDAKNDACKKVLEYISRNWEKIFKK